MSHFDQRLLSAATQLGGELQLHQLARKLHEYVASLPGFVMGGIGVHDEEHALFRVYECAPWTAGGGQAGEASNDHPSDDPTVRSLLDGNAADAAEIRLDGSATSLVARLGEAGARSALAAPMILNDRALGALLVGFDGTPDVDQEVQSYLRRLGCVVTPMVWNCFTHERFRRGDRRRDMLGDLSNVINTTLDLDTVIASSRRAIAGLEGHCLISIDVLSEDGRSYRSYRRSGPDWRGAAISDEPERIESASSVMSWLLARRRTYESDDLDRRTTFPADERLRAVGVRRYVASPMLVRGRIVGALFFGWREPHQALRIDIWLYENIAMQLALAIDNAVQLLQVKTLSDRLAQQNVYLREEIDSSHDFGDLLGRSPPMQGVFADIDRVAATESTVLICGETGSGKELVARAIHARSPRSDQPMVKVNCAAIPDAMVESELFGHERGAFTSAVQRRIGRFELASDGTLFLDEVGELSLSAQSKLLRVLQDGEFQRVGGTKTLSTNARIIAATNRDLAKAVENGAFRQDLFYRLNVFPIEVPPLRERMEDIPLLVETFIIQLGRRMGKHFDSIDRASLDALGRRDWPGNVRELRHVIERAIILSDGPILRVSQAPGRETAPIAVVGSADRPFVTLRDAEADHIRLALEQSGGVVEGPRGAAKALGINPSTLRFRMRRLGIGRPRKPPRKPA
jgi:formate hydrogenlyase transcriptional activator